MEMGVRGISPFHRLDGFGGEFPVFRVEFFDRLVFLVGNMNLAFGHITVVNPFKDN